MKRLVAAILFSLFSWMPMLAGLASPAVFSVPACCRKGGKHQCVMQAHDESVARDHSGAPLVISTAVACPYSSGAASTAHFGAFAASPANAIYAALVSHPGGNPQTDADYRISSLRSRQKRGPPSV